MTKIRILRAWEKQEEARVKHFEIGYRKFLLENMKTLLNQPLN